MREFDSHRSPQVDNAVPLNGNFFICNYVRPHLIIFVRVKEEVSSLLDVSNYIFIETKIVFLVDTIFYLVITTITYSKVNI